MSPPRHRRRADAPVSPYPRSRRVNEVLRQVVAEEIERLADADERLRLLTVTGMSTSPDLRAAVVYLGTLEPPSREALEERRVQIQRQVARQVRLKRTPVLSFELDPAVVAGDRVEAVLQRLQRDEQREPGTEE